MSRLLDAFVQLRFWVATVVTLLSVFAAQILGTPQHWISTSLVFACSLGIYNLDHVVDRQLDLGRAPLALACLSLLSVLGLLLLSSPAVQLLILGGGAASCLYFLPFDWKGRRVRLENLPGMKPLLIGSAVSIACVLVPWFHAARPLTSESVVPLACLVTALLLICAANTLIFDLRDTEDDRRKGVPTAPLVKGQPFTRWLVTALLLVALLFAIGLPLSRGSWGLGLSAVGLLFTTWLLPLSTSRTTFSLVVDGMLALPSLVLLIRTARQ